MKITLRQAGHEDRLLKAHEGQTILSVLANEGLYIDAPCAGRGKCGKCRVRVTGELNEATANELDALAPSSGERLACQARILGPATMEIAAETRFSSVKGLGESELYEIESPLKYIVLDELGRQNHTDLMTTRGIDEASIRALDELASLDAARKTGLGVMWGGELLKVIGEAKKDEAPELLAAAIDLGTTGLAVAIIDVINGEVVAQGTALNPQTACGGDVISRITLAAEGRQEQDKLQQLVLDGLKALISKTAGPERLPNILAAAVSGNTTMMYLLAGVQPKGLAQSPYRPAFIKSLDISHLAARLGLDPAAKVLTSPNISAYVGGDITSGMLAVGLKKLPGTVLYIDIGTNGEIVLSHKGKLVGTSCAAGPALEGMNIICGQRATPGAVDSFSMDSDYTFKYSTIADAPASGICGSGLIDLTAALIGAGLIDKSGRLKPPKQLPPQAPQWLEGLAGGRFNFAEKVFFDQKDIRQVQLAKGAIAAAVEMLLAKLQLSIGDLDEVIIAGAFGYHLKPESLAAICLIPRGYDGPVRFVGNASLAGSARIILTPSAISELNGLAAEVAVLELGFDPQFQNTFINHLGF